jgi:hypothetical protein
MEAKGRQNENGKGNGFHFIYGSRLHDGRKRDKRDKKAPYKKAFQLLFALETNKGIDRKGSNPFGST